MRYLARRLGLFVVTLWAAMTINFFVPHLMPGSPADVLRAKLSSHGRAVSVQQLNAYLTSFGFDPSQGLFGQYLTYLKDMVTLHWGVSIGSSLGAPVVQLIGQALPWTLFLVGMATAIAFVLGTLIGIISGWRRGGVFDSALPPLFVVMSGLPYFWVGLVAIALFANGSHAWLPNDGNYALGMQQEWTWQFVGSVFKHAILPAGTIVVTAIGAWVLTMRNNMISTLAEDYVRMGRAKGLPNRRVMIGYAARNAFLPNLSGFAMSLGYVIAGTILVEYIFNYPGVGHMFFVATTETDFPLLQALFLLLTLAVLVCVLLCDLAIFVLDPRARAKG